MFSNKKVRKYWLKRFSEVEIDLISKAFDISIPKMPWKKLQVVNKDLKPLLTKYNEFIHPERDYADDTIGVEPKSIKKWLEVNTISNLPEIFSIINMLIALEINNVLIKDEEGFFEYDKIFNLITKNDKKILSIEESKMRILVDFLGYRASDEFIKFYKENTILVLSLYKMVGLENIQKYISKKEEAWKKNFKVIPKSIYIVALVSPDLFDFKYIKYIKEKTDQEFIDLNIVDQLKLASLINLFPYDLFVEVEDYNYKGMILKEENPLIELRKSIDIKLFKKIFKYPKEILVIKKKMTKKSFELFTDKLSSLNEDNVDIFILSVYTIVERGRILSNDISEFLLSLSLKSLILMKFTGNLASYFNLFKSRSLENDIKDISLKDRVYEISIMNNDDPDQLFLGDMTDCCQTLNGAGSSCLTAGIKNKNNGFISLKKKGKVHAQSWFWEGEYNGDYFICFDSIELLSKENAVANFTANLFKLMAEEILKKYDKYSFVITGADGNKIPNEVLEEVSLAKENKFLMEDTFIVDKYKPTYTDINELGYYILSKREK